MDKPTGQLPLRDIIHRLNGAGAVARRLGIGASAVSSWRRQREVPAVHAVRIAVWLGVPLASVRPDMVEPEAAETAP